jgi:hypothetical protein
MCTLYNAQICTPPTYYVRSIKFRSSPYILRISPDTRPTSVDDLRRDIRSCVQWAYRGRKGWTLALVTSPRVFWFKFGSTMNAPQEFALSPVSGMWWGIYLRVLIYHVNLTLYWWERNVLNHEQNSHLRPESNRSDEYHRLIGDSASRSLAGLTSIAYGK